MSDQDLKQPSEAPNEAQNGNGQPEMADPNSSNPAPLLTADGQPISKSQLKKLKKREQNEQRKREKKEQEKAKRKAELEERQAKIREGISKMTEEEYEEWKLKRAAKVEANRIGRQQRKQKGQQGMESGQRIVIDLDFIEYMTEVEIKSIVSQVAYCYSANLKAEVPCSLVLTGVQGKMEEALRKSASGFDNWLATKSSGSYLDYFATENIEDASGKRRHIESKEEDLVYLTADSPNELQELDPTKVYIIGGIVDRNKHKGLCFNKAEEQGISTARLPIGEYLQLTSSTVMTTNHVVEIMLKWLEVKDWEVAFSSVVPNRKRKEPSSSLAGDKEEEKEVKTE